MPFVTDDTWSPARYRIALAAWQRNAARNESEILPRSASTTKVPRHGDLARKLGSLLTWRSLSAGADWTSIAANDNSAPGEPDLIDSDYTIRPRLGEIFRSIKDVEFTERRHAKLGGGGETNVVAISGDIERAKIWPSTLRPRRVAPAVIVRLGKLEFSNGGCEEPALILSARGIEPGAVRIPLGGLKRFSKGARGCAGDSFGKPKGANDNHKPPTVGCSQSANNGAMDFSDPVVDMQEARRVRKAVAPGTAMLLDFAIRASNFREIGERIGYSGKHAERKGKAALIEACEELDAILAA
ncbi:hypothetical protein [Rhizobium redzepovicii]|uniref:hypothetical protein n=1 Tax=Rhizobium redzepovicii TaxID=2867518 RepID=UPI001C92CE8E|nr:hypothetical protein [Rhizobium redzepovicii]MBY4589413.1 hypothetical protein [Rhizobium redzepovicii]